MVVVTLCGGIGNQMFEYAAAKTIAEIVHTDIVVNKSLGFIRDKDYQRVYCLDSLNVNFNKNRFLTFDFFGGHILEKISKLFGFHILFPRYKYLSDNQVTIEKIKTSPSKYNRVILQGAWMDLDWIIQNPKSLICDFEIKVKLPSKVIYYYDIINSSDLPVVALGVRVYQDVKDDNVRKSIFFSTQSDYYERAIDYLLQRLGQVKFLVFTQVREWVEQNIDFRGMDYLFVDAATCDNDAIYDMSIISKCHHAIISNSSFYFWGVWMMQRDDNVVIIPNNWGKRLKMNNWIEL